MPRQNPERPLILLFGIICLQGCGSAPEIPSHTLSTTVSKQLAGKVVAIETEVEAVSWKSGLHAIGQNAKPGETETLTYDAQRPLKKGLIAEDTEIALGTREQVGRVEPTIKSALAHAGANVTTSKSDSDYLLHARLTFGPTPAPVYADFSAGKSLALGLATLGNAPHQYQLKTDYRIALSLTQQKTQRLLKEQTCDSRESYPFSVSRYNLVAQLKQRERDRQAAEALFVETLEACLNRFTTEL